jgi:hypothetical protein
MQRLHGRVEHRQHHLKHRTAAALALRIQNFHQLFKRQIRMRIRAQRSLLHSPQYLPKRRISRQVGPHNQSVDKEADEPLNLGSIPPRNRRPNQNVVFPVYRCNSTLNAPSKVANRVTPSRWLNVLSASVSFFESAEQRNDPW